MPLGLDQSIAHAMEIDVSLLPLLPELLLDLWELGPSAEQVVALLQTVGVEPASTVLDLGCGKGAVAVALAEHGGLRVQGVDGFLPFVEAARVLATERGVSQFCHFEQGDIRTLLAQEAQYDVGLLLSVGPVLGDYARTMAGLRRLVRAGGYLVIEDGFLVDDGTHPPAAEAYARHSEVVQRLTAGGDALVHESICPPELARTVNLRNMALIRRQATRLKARYPALVHLIDEYVARQERETEILDTDVRCALWVLRRAW